MVFHLRCPAMLREIPYLSSSLPVLRGMQAPGSVHLAAKPMDSGRLAFFSRVSPAAEFLVARMDFLVVRPPKFRFVRLLEVRPKHWRQRVAPEGPRCEPLFFY